MVFKKIISFIFLCSILFFSCATSNNSSYSESDIQKNMNSNPRIVDAKYETSMEQIIQQLSGVVVRGSGNNTQVIVMTGSFFTHSSPESENYFNNESSEPLFLLNGSPYSTDFQSVREGINPQNVKSVEVYKKPHELARYGLRGSNGVINIKLK
ncbi:TonB-dependent receptor plug domain-containing protein [Lutimonas zeaxanthinifaciens]|uniref:TonB-dependent receptor plug domain-containing protein n=1 Tax=Lutimonas zeaxanthinifaciens TaxID=3060215 RepID=UPI003204CAE2